VKRREMRQTWQHAAKLILNRMPVESVTRQLSLALCQARRAPSRPLLGYAARYPSGAHMENEPAGGLS